MSAPAFQLYPGDWLGSQRVQMLTLEEEGAYFRLLCYCWKRGHIPSDPESLVRLIGKGASTTVATTVATMFQPDPNDSMRLIHDRLDEERRKQEEWREKSAKGGRNSAKSRKSGKGGNKGALREVEPPLQPNGNQTSTLLSSSSIEEKKTEGSVKSKAKAISSEEAEEYALSIGADPGQGDAFYWKMEGCGWTNDGKPVKNWKATVMAWHKQGYLPVPVNVSKPEPRKSEAEFTYTPEPFDPEKHARYSAKMAGTYQEPEPGGIEYVEPGERD